MRVLPCTAWTRVPPSCSTRGSWGAGPERCVRSPAPCRRRRTSVSTSSAFLRRHRSSWNFGSSRSSTAYSCPGTARARLAGECVRCLEPVVVRRGRDVPGAVRLPGGPRQRSTAGSRRRSRAGGRRGRRPHRLEDDLIDLEPVVGTRWCSHCRSSRSAGKTARGCAPSAGSCSPTTRTTTTRPPTRGGQPAGLIDPQEHVPKGASPRRKRADPWPFPRGRPRAATRARRRANWKAAPLTITTCDRCRRAQAAAPRLRELRHLRQAPDPLGLSLSDPVRVGASPEPWTPARPRTRSSSTRLGVAIELELARPRADAPLVRLRERRPADQRAAGVPRRLGPRPGRHRHPVPHPPRPARGAARQAARGRRQHAGARRRRPRAWASARSSASAAARRRPAAATSPRSSPTPSRP